MKVGDLVKIAEHCKNKGRMAIVVRTETWERNGCWIKYLDGLPPMQSSDGYAMNKNLILLSSLDNSLT